MNDGDEYLAAEGMAVRTVIVCDEDTSRYIAEAVLKAHFSASARAAAAQTDAVHESAVGEAESNHSAEGDS